MLSAGVPAVAGPPEEATSAAIDFNRDIRPLLSDKCFACHGQDEQARASGLRLDIREEAIDSGAIVPEAPEESSLVDRIGADDEDLRMPPPDSGKELTDEQAALFRQWIAQGAAYERHWAFRPISQPERPTLDATSGQTSRNAIDDFVIDRLRQRGLSLSAPASREVLIRRLYQDLLGLLPEVDEVEAFVNDPSPDAYEQLVDRLLNSEHYGERWGRHWLDQARYADSHGYTIDGSREMWPYRDWVINALNQDMPFDQFTIEQLAGDLLPQATKSQQVATAFHRNTMINQEGGVKADQYRHEAIIDRVNTTAAVWLGLTFGCAQCHSHKYDPVSHQDYYRFYAFFNGGSDANNTGPTVEVGRGEMFGWTPQQQEALAEWKRLRKELQIAESKLAESDVDPSAWTWDAAEIGDRTTVSNAELQLLTDGSLLAGDDVAPNDTYRLELKGLSEPITAVRLRLLTDPSLPASGPGRAGNGNFVLTDVALELDEQPVRFSQAWADHSQNDYEIGDAIDEDSQTGWAINVNDQQRREGHVMNAAHQAVFVLPKPVATAGRSITLVLRHDRNADYQLGRFAIDTSHSSVPESESRSHWPAEVARLKQRLEAVRPMVPGEGRTVSQMVMAEQASPPETFRLDRGDFLTPATEEGPLQPGVPESIDGDGERAELQSRLDLAKWLVSRDNPLTARVLVNRVWSKYFGRGLVQTENDFGFQGTPPSHPKLLDWLADDLMRNGWSLKALHRRIVRSATYRQSSQVTAEKLAKDPVNQWLSRQSRFRVEGEIVRDQALVVSEKLTPRIGGPSVYPPQPDGVFDFTQQKKSWPTETGPDRYRRTLYTMFYRSAPYPLLTTFDAPDFSTTCTARVRSNTPLQALAVANDPMFVELARGMAQSVLRTHGDDTDATLTTMFRKCFSRSPEPAEMEVLQNYHARQLEYFAAAPQQCREFVGEESAPLAAATSVARLLMNKDEFVTRN
ncbi:DUF1553 domain-containing protein [Roseiconus nitratireducens]|uniref:DUF1553 domain-containing protein n=1 Tax=Roseiconus nitratireducens TaxID=2605748 RepID=A0A5M6D7X4_9BACT|nr:PSD1 and planctomycete cytochrome C domain-containing protein [Roseiconus nitratireducens]KAA5541959.1 DUF1553 domain-containing protein [Roseiconus nitratireducens]